MGYRYLRGVTSYLFFDPELNSTADGLRDSGKYAEEENPIPGEIEKSCLCDNKSDFVNAVEKITKQDMEERKSMIAWALVTACSYGAVECVSALINADDDFLSLDGSQNHIKYSLFIHCPPFTLDNRSQVDQGPAESFSKPAFNLEQWHPESSEFPYLTLLPLILYVSHPDMEYTARIVWDLVLQTEAITSVIFDCVKRGNLVQLAFIRFALPDYEGQSDKAEMLLWRMITWDILQRAQEFFISMGKEDEIIARIALTYSISLWIMVLVKHDNNMITYLKSVRGGHEEELVEDREGHEEELVELDEEERNFYLMVGVIDIKTTERPFLVPFGNVVDKMESFKDLWMKYN